MTEEGSFRYFMLCPHPSHVLDGTSHCPLMEKTWKKEFVDIQVCELLKGGLGSAFSLKVHPLACEQTVALHIQVPQPQKEDKNPCIRLKGQLISEDRKRWWYNLFYK